MVKFQTGMPGFSQTALGIIIGCLPVFALILLACFRSSWVLIYCIFLAINLALYLYLRYLPWVGFGILLSLINIIPLFLASFSDGDLFYAVTFDTAVIYYLPVIIVGLGLAEGSGMASGFHDSQTLASQSLNGLIDLLSMTIPWLSLGLMKLLGLKPFGWPLALYIILLAGLAFHYVRRRLVPALNRISAEPLPTVMGLVVCTFWFYGLGFLLFYELRDTRSYSLIYSPDINFTSAAVYYALYFATAVLIWLTQADKINALVAARQKQLEGQYEDLARRFESLSLQKAQEKKDGAPQDPAQVRLYDLTGLSANADKCDLEQARLYWARRLGTAWTGKSGQPASEDKNKLREINVALDALQKKISK